MDGFCLRAWCLVLLLASGCSCGAPADGTLPAAAKATYAAYAAAWQQRDVTALVALQAPDRGLPTGAFYDELFVTATVQVQYDGSDDRQDGADTWARPATWQLLAGDSVVARRPGTVTVARRVDGQWQITSPPEFRP